MLDFIPKWAMAALLAMLAATSCKLKFDKDGLSLEVEKHQTEIAMLTAQYATERATASEAFAEATEKARVAERAIVTAVADERKMADERVKAVQLAAADLRNRLRYSAKEARTVAASVSVPSAPPRVEAFAEGSHGAELREDAIFLVGEAERADTIRVELNTCYASYEKARQVLNELISSEHSTQTNPPDRSGSQE
jgi:hypothetical protein